MKTLRNTEAVMQTYLQKYLRKYLKVTVKAYMQKGLACGTAVEFYNIVYITDNDTNRVIVISPLINKAEFMSVAFKKPFPYTIRATDMSLRQSKMQLILLTILKVIYQHSHRTEDVKWIRNYLNGPEVSVAGVTMKSV